MAKQVDNNITNLDWQHEIFMKEIPLDAEFKFRIWCRVQVETGRVWQVYRDGVLYEQLKAGPHMLWNRLWHHWKALSIDLRIRHLPPFTFEGRVKGPPMPREAQSVAGVDLGCTVKATLELSCKIANIETFLQYEEPISVFLASLTNMTIEMIGKLPYDQFGEWATTLRDGIRERLQGGRNDAERLIGMRVEEVYVTKVEPNTSQDRNMMAMYQQVERVRRELTEAQANRQRDTEVAQSFAEQGSILNIAPAILALQDSPIGKEIIARDAELRKMMVAAGLNPGVSVQPLRDPQGQVGGPPPSAGYLNPPRPNQQLPSGSTDQMAFGNTDQMAFASGSLAGTRGQSGQFSTFPPSTSSGSLIDTERQESELTALQTAGFQCAGRGQHSPTFDSNGQPIPGSMEWVLEVYVQRISGFITVVFHCPASYPSIPPRVQVRTPSGGVLRAITPNAARTWNANSMLVEIVREIDDTTP
jgi:hypothetical protein